MDLGLKDKVVIVTGAGSGIGRKTAELFAAEGARVALCDLNAEGIARTQELIAAAKGQSAPYPLDVTSHKACETTVKKIAAEMGPLYAVCNVAGVLVATPFEESAPENWEAELNVCLKGTMNLTHAALPELKKGEYNKIVNVASEAGRIGERSMVAYSAAKGGVLAFTKAVAKVAARYRTNVNVVCPATTKTPMVQDLSPEEEAKWVKLYPLRRLGEPADIADAILFLASQRANWITGQALSVNGGFAM